MGQDLARDAAGDGWAWDAKAWDLAGLRQRLRNAAGEADPAAPPPVAERVAAPARSDDAMDLVNRPLIPAAVLVGILHGPEPAVLLTKRTSTLRSHAGQVAFPGGRMEPGDAGPEAAALREAWEEVAIPPDMVEVVGRLPDYATGTGYRVSPVLGLLPAGLALRPNPDEVAAIFTLPLRTVLDPAAPQRRSAEFRGRMREFWVWPHPEHYVWGATAAILVHLAHRLRSGEPVAAPV